MAGPILPIPQGYFSYIPTKSESESDKDWTCGVCQDGEVKENRVYHLGDGRKHPFHTDCVRPWAEKNKTCPTCRVDPTDSLGLINKTKNVALRFLNRQLSWIAASLKPSPEIETLSGLGILVAGVFAHSPTLSGLGWLLQAHGVKRIHTPQANERLNQLKEIEHCARSLYFTQNHSQREIYLLTEKIERNRIFNRELAKIKELLASKNGTDIEDGLEIVMNTCYSALCADTVLHGYRAMSILGIFYSLYQAGLMGE